MALSDRDYITRKKKRARSGAGSGRRRTSGPGQTWMGVNRNFVLGALIVIALCIAVYVLRVMQAQS